MMHINISVEFTTIETIQKIVEEFSKIEKEYPNVTVNVEAKVS